MEPTRVEDDESLYRSIRADSDDYVRCGDGTILFSASSFNDRYRRPSVDRSALRADPGSSRRGETDGIAKVIAHEVRSICDLRVAPSEKDDQRKYAVDAIHRPISANEQERENLAHCQIECAPEITATHLKKLKDALARLASNHGFVVEPESQLARR